MTVLALWAVLSMLGHASCHGPHYKIVQTPEGPAYLDARVQEPVNPQVAAWREGDVQ
jgi:hypothetical protein